MRYHLLFVPGFLCCLIYSLLSLGLPLRAQTTDVKLPLTSTAEFQSPLTLTTGFGKSHGFVQNMGQWNSSAHFLWKSPGITAWITSTGFSLDLYKHSNLDTEISNDQSSPKLFLNDTHSHDMNEPVLPNVRNGHVLRYSFVNSHATPDVRGHHQRSTRQSFFLGNDSSLWRTDVPSWNSVSIQNLYDGIDLLFIEEESQLRYDLHLAPGTNPASIQMMVEGADQIDISDDGKHLSIAAGTEIIEHRSLRAYQDHNGIRNDIPCTFQLVTDSIVGFELGDYNRNLPLVIDPLIYSTLFDIAGGYRDITLDDQGLIYIAGSTRRDTFLITPGTYADTNAGIVDMLLLVFNPELVLKDQLLYATLIGGPGSDHARALEVGPDGVVTIGGDSRYETGFPTTSSAFQKELKGSSREDIILLRIDPFAKRLDQLQYSTYIGSSASEYIEDMAMLDDRTVVFAGSCREENGESLLTTEDAFDRSIDSGTSDGFVMIFDPTRPEPHNQIRYCSYFGGEGYETARDIYIDESDRIYLTGVTTSKEFPVTPNALMDTIPRKPWEWSKGTGFVVRIDQDNSEFFTYDIGYATYLGGDIRDEGLQICSREGKIYVSGYTASRDFPVTSDAIDTTHNTSEIGSGHSLNNYDAFLTIIDPYLPSEQLVYSTYIGAYDHDQIYGMGLLPNGEIVLVGETKHEDERKRSPFPVTPGAFDTEHNLDRDIFICRIDPSLPGLHSILYSSYFGASGIDYPRAFHLIEETGTVAFIGYSLSQSPPTTIGAFLRKSTALEQWSFVLFSPYLPSRVNDADTATELSTIRLFPNPTQTLLNLEWGNQRSEKRSPAYYTVYSLMGAKVMHGSILHGKSSMTLDVQELSSGEYSIRLSDTEGVVLSTTLFSIVR